MHGAETAGPMGVFLSVGYRGGQGEQTVAASQMETGRCMGLGLRTSDTSAGPIRKGAQPRLPGSSVRENQ